MPRLDGTGPRGQGPRTGRGLGNCSGVGCNQGLGQGRGFQNLTKEEQKKRLEIEKERIEQEIANLNA